MENRASGSLGLGNKIAENSRVWVVWPDEHRQAGIEKIVRQCLSLKCSVTIISDFPTNGVYSRELLGIKARSVYELLTPDEESAVVKAAYDLAGHWFDVPAIDKALVWRGIRLSEMLERVLPTFSFLETMRLVESVLRWVERERPDAVVLMDHRGKTSVAFQQVMDQEKIPIIFASAGTLRGHVADLMETAKYQILYGLLDVRDIFIRGIWVKLLHVYGHLRERSGDKSSPLAVFVGFDRNHYKHILPIAEHLRRKDWQVRVLRGLTGKTWYAAEGRGHPGSLVDTVDGYVTAGIWSRYRTAKRQIMEMWKHFDRDGIVESFFVYRDVNIWPLVKRHLQYCFYVYLPTSVRYMELTMQIINEESPRVFIFGNDSCSRGHAMIAAARQQGIPTVVVQHGIAAAPWDYVPYGDKMIIWGEHSRNALIESGADREKLVCAGAPGLDPLISLARDPARLAQRRAAACCQLGIKDTTDLVLLLTSAVPNNYQTSFIRMVFQVAKDLWLGDRFVVKLHPNETGKVQRQIALDMGIHPLITREVDLWGVIAASRAVITSLNSTAGIEALILRKPVIAVKTMEHQSIYANTTGLVYQVETKEDLKARLQQLLNEHFTPDSSSLRWFVGPLDGKATMRVADFVAGMREL